MGLFVEAAQRLKSQLVSHFVKEHFPYGIPRIMKHEAATECYLSLAAAPEAPLMLHV